MAIPIYVARQPVLDTKGRTFGYELLYRDSLENLCKIPSLGPEEDRASWKVLAHSILNFGLNTLAFRRRVFVNFTENLLKEGVPFLLPPNKLMIEILERIEDVEAILPICKRLRKEGYSLVLDDFRLDSPLKKLLPLVDFVKIDIRQTPWPEVEILVREYGKRLKLIAEKVETQEEFQKTRALGFKYFQGFFFARPQVLSVREIPVFKRNYLRLMSLLHSPRADLEALIKIINTEPSLALKLLRYVNSAFFGLPKKIKSVKHAAILLGIKGLKKWGSLITVVSLAEDRPPELVILSVVRARFMELLAQECGFPDRAEDAFMVGLFSLLDAMTDQPIFLILKDLPIEKDLRGALLGKNSPFTPLLELVKAYEEGHWERISEILKDLPISQDILPEIYLKALTFAQEVFALKA